jgi:hypothetical protein
VENRLQSNGPSSEKSVRPDLGVFAAGAEKPDGEIHERGVCVESCEKIFHCRVLWR